MHATSHETDGCIDACLACHKPCLGMAMTHCLEAGGEHISPQHFRLMVDCAAICATAADLMSHKSQFHKQMCGLCAEVCDTCADDCERLDGMEACVEACRTCAARCREMAA
jgi:hypothetical protein